MEDVLDLYAEPYKAWQPVVCMDERPCQLVADTLEPLPRQPGNVMAFAMRSCSFNRWQAGER